MVTSAGKKLLDVNMLADCRSMSSLNHSTVFSDAVILHLELTGRCATIIVIGRAQ